MLTREEEEELFERLRICKENGDHRGTDRVLQKIVTQFTPLASKLVRKMAGYDLDRDDLMSESLLALSSAAHRFDPSKGFRFATYAQSWIRGMLFSYVTKNYFMPSVCTNSKTKRLFFSLRRYASRHIKEHGEFILTDDLKEQISNDLDVPIEEIERMNNVMRQPYESLNVRIGDEDSDSSKQDMIPSEDSTPEEFTTETSEYRFHAKLINTALSRLTEREREIIKGQVLTDKEDNHTLGILGDRFGISRERVRQIRNSAMKKVEKSIRSQIAQSGSQLSDVL